MKRIVFLITILIASIALTGCLKRDDMENIRIITTSYPITYLAEKIYGNNSTVESIYPNGVNIYEYELTDKQINEYSKYDLFIYNGLDQKEKRIATQLLNNNKNIKLIDATQGLKLTSSYEELWLSPANYLMLAQNIKEHLEDYIKSSVIKTELNKNYENIKLTISKIDANFKIIAENANAKDLIVANQSLKFLSRYGYNVVCIDEKEDRYKSNVLTAKEVIKEKNIQSIFSINGQISSIMKELNKQVITIKSMENLSEEDAKNQITYEGMMNEFLENLRNEVYT